MKVQFFFLLLFFNIALCMYSFAQASSKDTIYVESVDFNILTFYSISCDNFATNFNGRMKFRVISDNDTTGRLDSFLKEVRFTKKSSDIDVREKIIYERGSKSKVVICTDGHEASIDGRVVRRNSKFVDFLRSLIIKGG